MISQIDIIKRARKGMETLSGERKRANNRKEEEESYD